MKILQADAELRKLFSPAEQAAYLGDAWDASGQDSSGQTDMTTDEVCMSFEVPACGNLNIKGGYKAGEKNFVIKFTTEFQPATNIGNGSPMKRRLTLVGDAQTGVITAMLPERSAIDHDEEATFLIPQLDWTEIRNCLKTAGDENVWQLQKEGFKAFSAGEVTIPKVIYLPFHGKSDLHLGDLHLKGAHKKGGDIYVFKIATGFPGNSDRGLLPTQGMMMAFDTRTGAPLIVLRDEGHLTDLRTAIAGRNAAEELMPADDLTGIGVLGTGVQARLQISLLKSLYPRCHKLTVWGHTHANTVTYAKEMTENGWVVTVVATPGQVADAANLIITTTPSEVPLLDADDITKPNSLIIAIGADMPGKIELSPALLKKADCVLIDSIAQGKDHGNAAGAIKDNVIAESDLQEFGDFLNNGLKNPETAIRLRLFLSSGIGVQDLQIVQAVIAGSRPSADEIPNFDKQFIARLVMDLYGIEGEISTLVSYEDQNALIKASGAKYVLKIANKKWSQEFVQAQTDVLEYLRINAPGLTFPSVIETLEGNTITHVKGFAVRLLTYLEGDLLTNTPRTPELYQDVGRFLGQFSKAMQTYPPDSVEGSDELWKLDKVMACKTYLSDVADEEVRDQFKRLYEFYERNILPRLPRLRKAVIHSDANEQNFLVDPLEPLKISGLIDFGEMQYGSQVNDLAITLAYGLLGENNIAMASAKIIEGYDREFKLEAEEREILYYLMAMRLVTTITMSYHNAKLQPDNEYLLVTQKPARVLLRQLEEQKYILV